MIEYPGFWFALAFAFAAATLAFDEARGVWLLCTMLASANFGAKCVRQSRTG